MYEGPKICRFELKGRVIFQTFVFAKKPSNFLNYFGKARIDNSRPELKKRLNVKSVKDCELFIKSIDAVLSSNFFLVKPSEWVKCGLNWRR